MRNSIPRRGRPVGHSLRRRTEGTFRVKEEDDSSNVLSANEVTTNSNLACTHACTTSAKSGVPSDGTVAGAASNLFAAALVMIAGLPLSDADKAEAVKRLLAQGQR